ncbi:UNVERIFIED_CONTAM: hypothetical protein H355_015167 [Colinus virginianus]|nr:hypothetical protein H355_015167 [Colinus virginianus]
MGYNLSYGPPPEEHLSPASSAAPNRSVGPPGNTTQDEFTTIVLPVLYLVIFLASILLNGLAIIQDSQLGPWHFNSFLCRYTTVLFYANMYTTIVFLGLISIDRYLKVVKPFGDSRMRNIDDCIKLKSPLGVKWHTAVIYINTCTFMVVLIVLIGCYIAISRIPFTFSHLDKLLDDSAHKILYYCKEMTLFLSACNVCLDPIIYFFMCRSFSRRLFRKSNMRTRSESIRSLQSVRRSEVRIYHEYTDV